MPSAVLEAPPAEPLPGSVPGLRVHLPELDGVRGVAVLLVVLYHLQGYAGVGNNRTPYGYFASMGWSGVDLFFVLSGFLITGILLDTRAERKYFQKFYARRVLRIFPLYYFLVGALFVAAPLLLHGASRDALIGKWIKPGSQIFAWTFTLNFPFAFDYTRISRLIHPLWSLSIEEQFYLVWPLAVYLLRQKTLRVICFALVGSALLARIGFVAAGQKTAAFALTPCRTDALALGALLALTVRTPGGLQLLRRRGAAIATVAFAGIVAVAYFRGIEDTDPVILTLGISLLGIFYASAMGAVVAAPHRSRAARTMRLPALRFLGKYSYAIYMFHQAIILAMLRMLPPAKVGTLAFSAVFAVATISAAMASWWLLEKRFLALRRAFRYET